MARQQHYVPRLHLKGFLDPKSLDKGKIKPYLWQVDLNQQKIKAKSPKNVAKAAGFYDLAYVTDLSLEDIFQKIESTAAPILLNLRRNYYELDEEERFIMSIYLALQIGRVPVYQEIATRAGINKMRREIRSILKGDDRGIQIIPPDNFGTVMAVKASLDIWIEVVFSMNWLFVTPPKDIEFYTSDNPAALLVPFGMPFRIDEHLQLWFSISPSIALYGHFTEGPEQDFCAIDSEVAYGLNLSTLSTSQRFAFCASKDQAKWVLRNRQSARRLEARHLPKRFTEK